MIDIKGSYSSCGVDIETRNQVVVETKRPTMKYLSNERKNKDEYE